MSTDLLLVGAGLILLTVGADRFVESAARLGLRLGVSSLLIGLFVIGMGTSLPEMLVSGISAARPGGLDLAMGNVVGSNIANLSLVLGVAALITPVPTPRGILHREGLIATLASALLAWFAWRGSLSLVQGVLLLVAGLVAILFIARGNGGGELEQEVAEELGSGWTDIAKEALWVVAGLAATLLGAQLLVDGARGLAASLGVSEALIGLSVVAVGTSLPELATAVAAARRRHTSLVLGNVLGSNLFNALLVAGVAATVGAGRIAADMRGELALMVGVSFFVGVVAMREDRLDRWEGLALLAAFPLAIYLGS
jgi:cation:H+ antiporter